MDSLFEESQISLRLEGKRNLPVRMRNAQAVQHSDKLYVGGGLTQRKSQRDEAKLYVYSPTTNTWDTAIATPVYWFALAIYRSKLVLVGGREYYNSNKPGRTTNKLYKRTELDWKEISPMKTKRHSASAISYADCLLVAGGHHGSDNVTLQEEHGLCDVEIFNGQQWVTTQPLPKPCWHMKSVIFKKSWCLIGGYGQDTDVYYSSLDSLTHACSVNQHHSTATSLEMPLDLWKKLPEIPNALSSPVVLPGEKLVAIGGEDTADIYTYSNQSKSWQPVKSDLPTRTAAVSNACTILLSQTGEILVIGGERQILEYSSTIFVTVTVQVLLKDVYQSDQKIQALGTTVLKDDLSGPILKREHLMNEVVPHTNKWMPIGLEVGLSFTAIERIEIEQNGQIKACFRKIFTEWENNSTTPFRWQEIICALEAPSVGEISLASQLKARHLS